MKRENTTIAQVIEQNEFDIKNRKTHWRVLFGVEGQHETLEEINAAIEHETSQGFDEYEEQHDLDLAIRNGFITFHKDGFVLWCDDMTL